MKKVVTTTESPKTTTPEAREGSRMARMIEALRKHGPLTGAELREKAKVEGHLPVRQTNLFIKAGLLVREEGVYSLPKVQTGRKGRKAAKKGNRAAK